MTGKIQLPEIPALPPLKEIEGFTDAYRQFYQRRKNRSSILKGFYGDPADSLAECRNELPLLLPPIQRTWREWCAWRTAQAFHLRPPENRPSEAHLERIADGAAKVQIREEEIEILEEAIRGSAESEKREILATRKRVGSCQLRNGKIWKCDGRLILDGDGPNAYFEDTGEKLLDYLAAVKREMQETRERQRRERREAYARKGIAVED